MRQTDRDFGEQKEFGIWHRVGSLLSGFLFVCIFSLLSGISAPKASAAGATVNIGTKNTSITVGDTVYVVITVSSGTAIGGFEGYFTYDSRILQFVTGGNVIHGNDDAFRLDDTERKESATKITYSVKFVARKAGSVSISMRKPYHVYAGSDSSSEMSISYNSLTLLVNKQDQATEKPEPSQSAKPQPTQSAEPEEKPPAMPQDSDKPPAPPSETPAAPTANPKDVPGSDRLRKLKIKGVELAPDFAPNITKYSAIVTTDDKQLMISYETKDSQANVVIKGNKNLKQGKNTVRVIVTGTDGSKTKYRLTLNVQRTDSASQNSRITAMKKKGRLYLQGETQIEVLSAEEDSIPEGFEEREIIIDGQKITAYALGSSDEDRFVLIYGKGNEKELYLYDMEENRLMPYEKVRAWYRSMNGESVMSMSAEERTIQSLKYVVGIMAAFCGLMLLILIFVGLRSRWR